MSKKGFTLIELLVVIAIIGILSSVVLASLNTARDRGTDAAIKSEIQGMRAEAEIQADGGSYATVCDAGTDTKALFDSADGRVSGVSGTCVAIAGGWAAQAPLASDNAVFFCADSTGAAVETDGSTIDATSGSEDVTCS